LGYLKIDLKSILKEFPMPTQTVKPAGLHYLPNYLTQAEHDQLRAAIDREPWLTDLKRRVQHYGYRYDYKNRSVDPSMFLGPLPGWTADLTERFYQEKLIARRPDQLIVNEYLPGQGISPHIDCIPCFGDTILSVSLGCSCIMVLTGPQTGQTLEILLEPAGLLIFKGEARYKWKHSIPARKTDLYEGLVYHRRRRVSLTFRNVISSKSV
jgi:alkylated DNA repair dioxygenase AlkB